ncbi:transmembrane 220 family protein [Dyadobacter psychrotolerans]|uniref:Transmembrane family 220, helix n=1 Tax=Dyadobacter psychrotolerans TaxID=2541721 RepID=A0A4R5DUT5_9BACT|nr:transmembrane 220 family protein [Dyadobacter psychrotolerans]TDE16264.1 hypothetical protein E0F88_08425 [Dyadobacter psychrotolerans]
MKIFKIVFAIIFMLFSYVQFNDPDPAVWVFAYSFAALACYMSVKELWPSWTFYTMAATYLVAAILQWPPEFEGIFFGETMMRSINIELARESLGLGICFVVMVILGKWG